MKYEIKKINNPILSEVVFTTDDLSELINEFNKILESEKLSIKHDIWAKYSVENMFTGDFNLEVFGDDKKQLIGVDW